MSILRGHCRPFLISIACGLGLICSPAIWAQPAAANRDSQSNADCAPFAIEKLAQMLIGNWDGVATNEPNAARKGRKVWAPIESFRVRAVALSSKTTTLTGTQILDPHAEFFGGTTKGQGIEPCSMTRVL
jgi:hypothetical protein